MISFINKSTGAAVYRKEPSDQEFVYTGKPLLVETDTEGIITYANRRFVEISGYTKEELIGSPHCIHLHPHMPEIIFKDACRVTSEGKTWSGYMCNISKEGIGYWTETIVQPKHDDNGAIIGYMATRKAPDPEAIAGVIEEYETLRKKGGKQIRSQYCGEVYLGRGACRF
jgi:PAS domain S-box-containing protein